MDIRVTLLLILEALFALFLLSKAGVMKTNYSVYVCCVLTFTAFFLRYLCMNYQTLDYINFLSRWVEFYRQYGGFKAMEYPVGNYNIPYLYFLAIFSYLNINDLYLIKLLTIFFDVLLAYGAMQLLGTVEKRPVLRIACFFTVLHLPTVILNGALWGQCDSMYVALALLAISYALEGRPVASIIAITLSFGFKLQAVFIMPVFAVLWMMKKISFRHFFIFPAAYVVLVLPAVIMGRPFMDTIMLYFNQTGSIGDGLNYNSSSVFSFFYNVRSEVLAADFGILAAFAAMTVIILICAIKMKSLNNKTAIAAAVLFAVVIPFLLPHMHDRYFFAADILTVVMAFAFPAVFPAAILTQYASLLGYHAYLMMKYLQPMRYGATALIAATGLAAAFFYSSIHPEKKIFEKFEITY